MRTMLLATAALVAAVLTATPSTAGVNLSFGFGVPYGYPPVYGGPVYGPPVYGPPVYYGAPVYGPPAYYGGPVYGPQVYGPPAYYYPPPYYGWGYPSVDVRYNRYFDREVPQIRGYTLPR